jgi:hypothetical protein
MLAFLSTGSATVTVPVEVDWAGAAEENEIHGSPTVSQQRLSFVNGATIDQGVTRNLQVEIHTLRRLLRTLGETWGVCVPMEATLKSLYEATTWLTLVAEESFLRGLTGDERN